MATNTGNLVNDAFQFLRAIAFVTPAVALLLNLVNPRRREGKEPYDIIIFPWVLSSFILLILAGIADVSFLIYVEKLWLLTLVKYSLLLGMIALLWATIRFLFEISIRPKWRKIIGKKP